MEKITAYQTIDNKVFVSEFDALRHENTLLNHYLNELPLNVVKFVEENTPAKTEEQNATDL